MLCLTEHFNTLSFREMYSYIYSQYEHIGDACRTKDGLLIFFGMEVDIAEGGHTLVIGHYQDIVSLNMQLDKSSLSSIERTLNSEYENEKSILSETPKVMYIKSQYFSNVLNL